jgi:hypothetical protein
LFFLLIIMDGKQPMTKDAAQRIQAAQDRKGDAGDQGFKSRAMAAAAGNEAKGAVKSKK